MCAHASIKPAMLVYLHGFNSSPASHKAQLLLRNMRETLGAEAAAAKLVIPHIPAVPFDAIDMLKQLVEHKQQHYTVALAGSSLGGFYATWLAQRYNCRAVLINPAVRPHVLLAQYLGENINYYTSERWILNEEHIQQFSTLDIEPVTMLERYLLLVQQGDETLDYRQAVEKYRGCQAVIETGGSHAFEGFDAHIDEILDFCGIRG